MKANIQRVLQPRGMVRTTKGMGIAGSGNGNFVQLFVTPWTVAHQVPLSMGFSRQEYWSRLPCPPPRDLPNPVIEPLSPVAPGKPHISYNNSLKQVILSII